MVRDDPDRNIRLGRFAVGNAGHRAYGSYYGCENVGIVIVLFALQHRGYALKPHACVYAGLGKSGKVA